MIILFLLLFLGPTPAEAVEPICPGGSAPRGDVIRCLDMEVSTNCTTGQENQCWVDNGFDGVNANPDQYSAKIVKNQTDAAVGSGYVTASARRGGTGPDHGLINQLQNPKFTALGMRWYQRFRNGYLGMNSGHGFGVNAWSDGFTATSEIKWQTSSHSNMIQYRGIASCVSGIQEFFFPNQPNTPIPLLTGRWYEIEVKAVLDTSCSDHTTSPWSGCNGSIEAWVDGVKTHSYLNINLGRLQCIDAGNLNFAWQTWNGAIRDYHHKEYPPWTATMDVDNVVFSNDGTYIGCANTTAITTCPGNAENARGTGDTSSPYGGFSPYIAHLGRHAGFDCTSNGFGGQYESIAGWRDQATNTTLDNTITHGLFVDQGCQGTIASFVGGIGNVNIPGTIFQATDGVNSTDCSTGGGSNVHLCRCTALTGDQCTTWASTAASDNSLKVAATSGQGGGIAFGAVDGNPNWPQVVNYGWVYLPSLPTCTVCALSGWSWFTAPSGNNPGLALAVNNGKWSIWEKQQGGTGTAFHDTATAVTTGAWHEYEIIVWANGTISLMIDRVRLYDKSSILTYSTSWVFNSVDQVYVIHGVVDYQGTGTLTAYFDDGALTTVSNWSCDGWGAANCPFAGGFMTEKLDIHWH